MKHFYEKFSELLGRKERKHHKTVCVCVCVCLTHLAMLFSRGLPGAWGDKQSQDKDTAMKCIDRLSWCHKTPRGKPRQNTLRHTSQQDPVYFFRERGQGDYRSQLC